MKCRPGKSNGINPGTSSLKKNEIFKANSILFTTFSLYCKIPFLWLFSFSSVSFTSSKLPGFSLFNMQDKWLSLALIPGVIKEMPSFLLISFSYVNFILSISGLFARIACMIKKQPLPCRTLQLMTSQVVNKNWSVLPERSRVKFFGLNITHRKGKKDTIYDWDFKF